MIVKILIISSISTISFIHICSMKEVNNNTYGLTRMAPPLWSATALVRRRGWGAMSFGSRAQYSRSGWWFMVKSLKSVYWGGVRESRSPPPHTPTAHWKPVKNRFLELLAASGSSWERLGIPGIDSGCQESIFDGFSIPTWHPKPIKIVQKSMPRCIPSWTRFFYWFLVDFYFQLRPLNLKNRAPAAARARSMKNGLSKFTLIFDAILAPTCLHFDNKNPTHIQKEPSQEASTQMIDFEIDLLAILAPFRNPSWDPRRFQNTSKTPQDAPGTAPRRLQDTLKTGSKPRGRPKTVPSRSNTHPGMIF